MQKLRTVIVDDEPLARKFLRLLLASFDDVEVVAECSNGKEAVATTLELRPQLLFLDIQMPGMNGFEVVKTLQSDIMPMAIFVTAFNQYAVDAFDLHAVDYVLKPLDEERIRRSVDRALDRLKSQSDTNFKTPLIGAIDAISKRMAANKPGDSRSESLPDGMKRKLLVRDSGVAALRRREQGRCRHVVLVGQRQDRRRCRRRLSQLVQGRVRPLPGHGAARVPVRDPVWHCHGHQVCVHERRVAQIRQPVVRRRLCLLHWR